MKIKDLLQFNPEADISIIMQDSLPFEGELSLGWTSGEGGDSEEPTDLKDVTEVCIFLDENPEQ